MASMNLRAPFSVQIKGKQLVVTQTLDGVRRVFCTLYIDDQASFCLRDGKVVYLGRYGQSFTFDTDNSEDAHELLNQLADVQLHSLPDELAAAKSLPASRKALHPLGYLAIAASMVLAFGAGVWLSDNEHPNATASVGLPVSGLVGSEPRPSQRIAAVVELPTLVASQEMVRPSAQPRPSLPQPAPSAAADDVWTLPDEIRVTLPDKFHKAAERKLFTVD